MRKLSLLSTLIYTSVSLVGAGTFFAVTLAGEYTWTARIGGALWVFGLFMIVLMPVTPSLVKRWAGGA